MAELIIQSGKLQGKRLVLPDKEVFVGRDEECHVRLASSLISRKHCSLKTTPDGLVVTDLQSQNGTFVNETPITAPTLLRPGDILQIGAILFQVPAPRDAFEPVLPRTAGKLADKSGGISDAEIASWLSDEFEKTSSDPMDTTIIKNPAAPRAAEPKAAVPAPATPAGQPPGAAAETNRRPPRTVKEQAAEIIRRHWSEVRGGTPPAP